MSTVERIAQELRSGPSKRKPEMLLRLLCYWPECAKEVIFENERVAIRTMRQEAARKAKLEKNEAARKAKLEKKKAARKAMPEKKKTARKATPEQAKEKASCPDIQPPAPIGSFGVLTQQSNNIGF